MKKRIIITISIILVIGVAIYFLVPFLEQKTKKNGPTQKHTTEVNYERMSENPTAYLGTKIEAEGLVDESRYIDGKGVYSVILLQKDGYTTSVVITEKDKKEALAQQSYVRFTGEVKGRYEGELDLGVQGDLVEIEVTEVIIEESEKSPDMVNIKINEEDNFGNVHVEVDKVRLYPKSTRIYLFLYNKNDARIYLNDSSIKLYANGKEIPTKYEVLDQSIRLARSLEPNKGTRGVLSFDAIPKDTKKLDLAFEMTMVNQKKPIQFSHEMNMKPTKK